MKLVMLLLVAVVIYHESVLGRLKIREKGHARELKHEVGMREGFYWEDLRDDCQMWRRLEDLEKRVRELERTAY